jgi:hypothetical protein
MIWKLFRPKPIVVIELPYEGNLEPKLVEEVIKTLILPLNKDYHVVYKFTDKLKELKLEVHNR